MVDDLNEKVPHTENPGKNGTDLSQSLLEEPLTLNGAKEEPRDFYAKAFRYASQADFDRAAKLQGLDDEITLLRVEISALVAENPYNIQPIQIALLALERLVKTRYHISKGDEQSFAVRMANVLANIDLPEGIKHSDLIIK